MKNIKTKVFFVWGAIVVAILVAANTEAKESGYINDDHKYFCLIAEDRGASAEYLASNQCPNEK